MGYGLISKVDASVLEKTLDLIMDEFEYGDIKICEVGIYAGETGNGMREYVKSKGRSCILTGIDNNKDGEKLRFEYDRLIIGNSNEVYNQLEDFSQHLIFIDGNHNLPSVVSDFFCYANKIRVGGFVGFHDTGSHIKPLTHYQGFGDKEDEDMYISVRKALFRVGLLHGNITDKWRLVHDEYDENNEAGGVCTFLKTY